MTDRLSRAFGDLKNIHPSNTSTGNASTGNIPSSSAPSATPEKDLDLPTSHFQGKQGALPNFKVCTKEQQSIVSAPEESLAIMALAGTGKTFTLLKYAEHHPRKKWLYLTYNRSLKNTIQEKHTPYLSKAATFHGYALGHYCQQNNVRPGKFLLPSDLLEKTSCEQEGYHLALQYACQQSNESPNLSQEAWEEIEEKTGCTVTDPHLMNKKLETYWMKMATHQMPIHADFPLKYLFLSNHQFKNPLLIDECQDIPPILWHVLNQQNQPKILAGDPYQNLYSWQGTVVDWGLFIPTQYWLTETHRFGEDVAAQANIYLSNLKSPRKIRPSSLNSTPLTGDAIITRTQLGKAQALKKWAGLSEQPPKLETKNNPFFQILKHYHESKMMPEKDFEAWLSTAPNRWQKAHELYQLQTPKDIEWFLNLSKKNATTKNQKIGGGTHILTAHESKGLEFKESIIHDDFLPHSEDPLEQRLLYVAHTRSRHAQSPYTKDIDDGF